MTNELHEQRSKPLRGFTPRERVSAADPILRAIGHTTEAIDLAGANTNPTPAIAGQSYNLGGFAAGIYRLTWADGANYAQFQAYYSGGSPAVKVMDASTDGEDDDNTTELRTDAVDVSTTVTDVAGAQDAVCFGVNDAGELVLLNDIDANSGDGPGPVLRFALQRVG